jgi:cell division protein FtsB
MPRPGRPQQKQPQQRRRTRFHPAYLVLAVILALFAVAFVRRIQDVRRLQAQDRTLLQQNAQTAADNARLRRDIRYYQTTAYVEEEARAVLGYTMPGDISILPKLRPAPVESAPRTPMVLTATPEPAWQQWWQVFTE